MPEPPPVDDDVIEGEHVSTEPEVVEMPEVEEETWDADTAPQVGSPATELATPDALVGLDLKAYTKNTNLNEMVPALINRQADFTLLDVPDAILGPKLKSLGHGMFRYSKFFINKNRLPHHTHDVKEEAYWIEPTMIPDYDLFDEQCFMSIGLHQDFGPAPVFFFASATVSNTGRSRCVEPPLPGVTPPTILVP